MTYSSYDSRGHAGRKVDGESVLAAGDWRKGKLKKATRYNYYEVAQVPPPGQIFAGTFECGDLSGWSSAEGTTLPVGEASCTPTISYDVEVEETYVYGGVGGRVSGRDTAITLNGNTGEAFTQGWTYTELGGVATVVYPRCDFARCTLDGAGSARTVGMTYTRGYLTGVTGYGSITYQPNGLYDTITHSNGVVVTQAADPHGMSRPASITATIGAATHWTTGTYTWDGAGNVKGIGDSRFVYDEVSRLTLGRVSTNAMSSGAIVQQGYTYDAFGNIQSITGSPGRATPTNSATNRLQGASEYSEAGNLTSWNGNVYEYDAFHMMTRMIAGTENWLYVYTADDERIWQFRMSAESATHRYTLRDLGGQVLREYSVGGDLWTIERDYVYRGGLLLAAETPEGERHFHLDHLRTPRLITGPAGGRVAYHVYFPFGEEATDPFQNQERIKFTGHQRDLADPDGTGDDLDYMRARFCSPLTGRFMSLDPIGGDPEKPQSWNRYAYVANNPMIFIDPTGRIAIALTEEAQEEILKLVGENAAAVSFLEDGTVVIDATADTLAGNVALDELHSLVESDKVFGLVVGSRVESSSGPTSLAGGEIENFSRTPDERLTSLGLRQRLPPDGFDAMVGIGLDAASVRTGRDGGLPASRTLLLFHELVESYHRTHAGKQYAPSHAAAIRAEHRLRPQRPEFGGFAFGAGPYIRRLP